MNAHTHTPWGTADSHEHIAEGIDFYGTPSHGGFKLSAERNAKVQEILRQRSFGQQGMKGWYEEDCDACIVMATFPEYFTTEQARYSTEFVAANYKQ